MVEEWVWYAVLEPYSSRAIGGRWLGKMRRQACPERMLISCAARAVKEMEGVV